MDAKPEDKLTVIVPGAAEAELERGRVAALAVFASAGVTAYDAAAASFACEGDPNDFTDKQAAIAHLWDDAQFAAAQACCAGWDDPIERADFELHWRNLDR